MADFVTLLNFQFPHEAYPIKSKLEAEGIYVYLKDEHTVQVHNFLSNAIGGIKLQVKEADSQEAIEILKFLGYIKEEKKDPDAITARFNRFTGRLPLISKNEPAVRTIIFAGVILLVIGLLAFVMITCSANL